MKTPENACDDIRRERDVALIEIDYNASKLTKLQGLINPDDNIAAVDPGGDGALVQLGRIAQPYGRVEEIWPLDRTDCYAIGVSLASAGVTKLFVETQHLQRDPHASIRLSRRAAYLPAFYAGMLAPKRDVTVVWMHPASWHTWLREQYGGLSGKGAAKQAAMWAVTMDLGNDPRFSSKSDGLKQGIADAYCMARWAEWTFCGNLAE